MPKKRNINKINKNKNKPLHGFVDRLRRAKMLRPQKVKSKSKNN